MNNKVELSLDEKKDTTDRVRVWWWRFSHQVRSLSISLWFIRKRKRIVSNFRRVEMEDLELVTNQRT